MGILNSIFNQKKVSEPIKSKKWVCDFCGTSNSSSDTECQDCGHEKED